MTSKRSGRNGGRDNGNGGNDASSGDTGASIDAGSVVGAIDGSSNEGGGVDSAGSAVDEGKRGIESGTGSDAATDGERTEDSGQRILGSDFGADSGDTGAGGIDGSDRGTTGEGEGGAKRRRGRPPREKDGSTGSSQQGLPREIKVIRGQGKQKKKSEIEIGTEEVVQFVYGLPALLGLGEHWRLSNQEAASLSKNLQRFSRAYPDMFKHKVVKAATKAFPAISLLGTAVIITAPRILYTRVLLNARKNGVPIDEYGTGATAADDASAPGVNPSGSESSEGGAATGSRSGDVVELFRRNPE